MCLCNSIPCLTICVLQMMTENVKNSNNITAQHYVKVNLVIFSDFVTNIWLHETLKISTKLVLWMSRKQQSKSDQLEKLLSVHVSINNANESCEH